MSILVIDIGTTGVRAGILSADGVLGELVYRRLPPSAPAPGLVEFDADELATVTLQVAREAVARHSGTVDAVGVTTQRASTVVWDRTTGRPVGPAIGWQDLRTVFDCIMLKADHGLALAPNQSATKLTWLLANHDPDRSRDLCFGTVDSWIAWVLTDGAAHVTDRSNAAVTGLMTPDASGWSTRTLEVLSIPVSMMPRLIDTTGPIAPATALPGAPLLASLVGDQQASLVGQSCVRPGDTKITFGTGAMLDVCVGLQTPTSANRGPEGTFPIVAWSKDGAVTWGAEAIMLSAGSNIEWLRDDLGMIGSAEESHEVASACTSTDGVVFVPALMGLGTPHWDYGARGALFGITRGTERRHVVRAVLEGVAHRGTDLVDAAEATIGRPIEVLRIDGGMSRNPTFVQALADASQRPVETAPVADATTLGAGYLAGLAVGTWSSFEELATIWRPAARVEPAGTLDRARFADAVRRARGWMPDLSALDF